MTIMRAGQTTLAGKAAPPDSDTAQTIISIKIPTKTLVELDDIFGAIVASPTVHESWLLMYGLMLTPIMGAQQNLSAYVVYWINKEVTIHRVTDNPEVFTVMRAGTREIAPNRHEALDIFIQYCGDTNP